MSQMQYHLVDPESSQPPYENTTAGSGGYQPFQTVDFNLATPGRKLLKNSVLVLEIDKAGILLSKKFYNKDDMNIIKFDDGQTGINYQKRSFIYNFLSSLRQKIDDPLNKKRIKKKD